MKPLTVTHLVRVFIFTAIALTLLALPQFTQAQSPTIIYVNRTATGTPNGVSWTTAYTNVQDALAVATNGQEIWVARGVYYPDLGTGQTNNNVNSTFALKSGVALYGGFAATETLRSQRNFTTNVTILSGDIDGNDTNTDGNFIAETSSDVVGSNAYHVVLSNGISGATLDGFTVTAGKTSQSQSSWKDAYGAGMLNHSSSSPTVSNVIFSGNSGYWAGGGMTNYGSSPILSNVIISGNSALRGGGMYNGTGSPVLSNSNVVFINNLASYEGGGMYNISSNIVMSNIKFISNSVTNISKPYEASGGAMYNSESVIAMSDMNFTGNSAWNAGAIFNWVSTTSMNNITFISNTSSDEGAIANTISPSTMNNIAFIGNSGYKGGAIYNHGTGPMMSNIIFSGNSAVVGGAVFNYDTPYANPTFNNVTFFGNSASGQGGAMWNCNTNVNLTNVVMWNNQEVTNTTSISSSIVNDPWCSNTLAISYSLIANWTAQGTGSLDGTNPANNPLFVNPINPSTAPTTSGDLRLLVGSPVINIGLNSVVVGSTDLDGNPRIISNTVDFGAYEGGHLLPPEYACMATLNGVTVYSSTDAQAVRDAVGAANSGDTVKVAGYCAGVVKQGSLTQTVYITKALTLRGGYTATDWTTSNPIANPTTLDAQGAGRVVVVNTALNTPVQLENLTLTHGLLTTTNQSGAGVYVTNATLVVSGSRVYSNSATHRGGGLYSNVGLTVINSQFEQNGVGNDGGALYGAGTVTVLNTTFSDNVAQGNGGAVRSISALIIKDSQFNANSATHGGAVYGNSATTVTDSVFTHNSASQNGGAVRAANKLSMVGTTFLSNTAFYGAGFYSTAEATVTTSQFTGNVAQNLGGGIYGNISSTLTISDSQFNDNTAQYGGGVYGGNSLEVTASTFTGNTSQFNGGGIRAAGVVTVTQTTFTYNIAQAQGGGLYSSQKTTVARSSFNDNTASHGAGIAISSGQPVVIVNSLFTYNNAVAAGGGIYVTGSGNETQIIHSTFVYNVEHAIYVNGGTTWITNNILALNNVGIQRGAGTVTQNYNLFYSNGEIAVGAVNGAVGMIIRNPLFVNPAAGDYRLQEGSLAIDSGLDMGITTDYFGNVRPSGTHSDRGYHEFDDIVTAASLERHSVYLPLVVR